MDNLICFLFPIVAILGWLVLEQVQRHIDLVRTRFNTWRLI